MVGLNLIREAGVAGLTVWAEGDRLRIRGPKAADVIARRLVEHKAEVMAALRQPVLEPRPIGCPWSNLIVRGPGTPPRLVSSHRIPADAQEYHWHGNDWRPIPDHWYR
jgi:hypothetical protein